MTPAFPGIIWECQVCHRDNVQRTDQDGFPERIQPCPWCEATARLAAGDLPHLNEARRLYLALMYVTSALDHCASDAVSAAWRRNWPDQARHTDRVIGRARKLMAELKHLKADERRRHGGETAEAETDQAPAPGHGLGTSEAGEHRPEARRLRGDTG